MQIFTGKAYAAVEYGGIGGRPAYPNTNNSRSESIFIHTTDAGKSISEGVKVINNTPNKKTLLIYATDSAVASGGVFTCSQKADPQKEMAKWINLTRTEVTLNSLTSQIVPFTINVPANLTPGEYDGCIIIQEKEENKTASGQNGITLSFRTGIRILITIPGNIQKNLTIENLKISNKPNGDAILSLVLKNTSSVSIDADIKGGVNYFFGLPLKTYGDNQNNRYVVLRNQSLEINHELEKPFWGGFYSAGFTAEYNPSLNINSTEKKKLESGIKWFFSVPHPVAAVIEIGILLLIIGSISYIVIQHNKKQRIFKTWLEYTVKDGDTINELAILNNIGWKNLAKANKLKAPYTIKTGQKLKVPPQKVETEKK